MSAAENPIPGQAVVRLGGHDITVRELTLHELRAHFVAPEDKPGDAFDAMLIETMDLRDLALFCDASPDALGDLRPSEIRELIGHVQKLNADFFAMRGRAERLITAASAPALSSNAASPA